MNNIVSEERTIKTVGEENLFLKKESGKVKNAVFVIVHGIAEHLGRYDYLSSKLVEEGYVVYRYDARGHGKSSGNRGDLKDFHLYLDDLDQIINLSRKENSKLKIFLLGHSMGGLVATAYACKYPKKINALILSGASNQTPQSAKKIKFLPYPLMWKLMYPNKLGDGVCSDKSVVDKYNNDPLVLKQMSFRLLGNVFNKGVKYVKANILKIKCPTLILHGEDDKIVDVETSNWTFNNLYLRDKKIKVYKGMMHEIFNEVEKDLVIKDVVFWSNKRF